MKKLMGTMLGVALAMGVAACGDGNGNGGGGGGGGGGGSEIVSEEAATQATQVVDQTQNALAQLTGNPDTASAFASVFGIYGNALGVASAQNQAALIAANDAADGAEAEAGGGASAGAADDEQAADDGASAEVEDGAAALACVTETANSVTWNNCEFSGYTIDGTISHSGNDLDIDLSIGFGIATVRFEGSITVSSSLIDGSLSVTSSAQSVDFSVDVVYDAIELTGGCPTGGSLTVTPSQTSAQLREVRAEFGPTCGDVHLYE